jgi:hypothetical protein
MLSGSQHSIQASDRAGIISVAANLNWAAERLNSDRSRRLDGLTANPSARSGFAGVCNRWLLRRVLVMQFRATKIGNVFVIEFDAQRDDGGFFTRGFCRDEFDRRVLQPQSCR